ncbi:putative MFS multidrug transporter [Dipodascopsis uninucleata]
MSDQPSRIEKSEKSSIVDNERVPIEVQPENKGHSRLRTVLLMVGVYLAMFLVALDKTLIATVIPRITDEFDSLDQVGWYGSAFMLTSCAFQLGFGRVYTFYPTKYVFLSAIIIFEIGSAICGAAPSSVAFIIGRAIAGLGSAGIFSGAMVIIVQTFSLQKRPLMQGLNSSIFGIASVVAPLLGGVFTEKVSWRWSFYINLVFSSVTIVTIIFFLQVPLPVNIRLSWKEKLARLDPIGGFVLIVSVVCLILALEWGGSTYTWSDGRIIGLLVVFALLFIVFIGVQIWKQETATVPPRIVMQRSVASGIFWSSMLGGSMMVFIYYLAIWFQAIKGTSAIRSGIMMLPLVFGLVIASSVTGILISRIGYYVPFMYLSTVLMSVGAGLISTFTVNTGHPKWIGYQALYGLGLGSGMMLSNVAAQTVLEKKDVPTGMSLMFFSNSLGGAIFLSVSQNILTTGLVTRLSKTVDLDPEVIINTGATNLRSVVSANSLTKVLTAYNYALMRTFDVGLGLSCACILSALTMEWASVRKGRQNGSDATKK